MSGQAIADSVLARLREESRRAPEREALVHGEQRLTYGEVQAITDRLAQGLREDGVLVGERLMLVLGNSSTFVPAYLASLKVGGVVVPVNPGTPPEALAAVLYDCTPTVAFIEPRHRSLLTPLSAGGSSCRQVYMAGGETERFDAGVLRVMNMEERWRRAAGGVTAELPSNNTLAAIVYTSGTTGVPKGVMLSHGNLAAVATAGREFVSLQPDDRIGVINPLFHLYGLREIDAVLGAGATLVLPSDPTFPARVLSQLDSERVTGFSAVPSSLALFLARFRPQLAASAAHLRFLTAGAAYASRALLIGLREVLPATRLLITYGLTEASRVCWREVVDPASESASGAVGRPYPGVQVWLVDEVEGLGRVALRSPLVMQGYWNRPDVTSEVLSPDGVLLTPDLGRFDADGTLFLLGRIDEVINRGGQKVNPEEVEGTLCQHPAVAAAAVFAVTDPAGVLGEVVQAIVVCHPGMTVTAHELIEDAATRLEPYKVPRSIEFAERLPRAVLGKVRRRVFRQKDQRLLGNQP